MNQSANLTLYFLLVFGIVALPGLDMAFVMGSAVLGGRRSGLAAVAGIVAGGFCHLLMGALGVAAVLRWWPPLFDVMLAGGALYLAWIGISLLRSSGVALPSMRGGVAAPVVTFRRAVITSLVNPKAYLFMLAVFPQFLHSGAGPIWLQAGVLGAITSATQAGVYGGLALLASRASVWLDDKPGASTLAARTIGLLLLGVAAMTAAQFGRVLP
ncbi:MAG: LysE family translocator [Pseudomonadota bacterium]